MKADTTVALSQSDAAAGLLTEVLHCRLHLDLGVFVELCAQAAAVAARLLIRYSLPGFVLFQGIANSCADVMGPQLQADGVIISTAKMMARRLGFPKPRHPFVSKALGIRPVLTGVSEREYPASRETYPDRCEAGRHRPVPHQEQLNAA